MNVKKVDCALLPPCRATLRMKLLRAKYVTILWTHSSSATPGADLTPTDYGWSVIDGLLKPKWYEGPTIPADLFTNEEHSVQERDGNTEEQDPDDSSESNDDLWSENSDELESDIIDE